MASKSFEERFWEKVRKTRGCWYWTASTTKRGYGKFSVAGRVWQYAHVVSYVLAFGEVPDGREVHHTCENKGCVRPSHLKALTREEHAAEHHVARCKYGHSEWVFVGSRKRRRCLVCRRESCKRYEKKHPRDRSGRVYRKVA